MSASLAFSRSITVLIADDHELVRAALRRMLVRAGMSIFAEASTPLEAIEHARNPRAEIVILDLSWNVREVASHCKDGLTVLLAIRAERASLPVLIYSGEGSTRSVESCRRLGANGYLIKGIDDSRLVRAVRAVYAGEKVWPNSIQTCAWPTGLRTLGSS